MSLRVSIMSGANKLALAVMLMCSAVASAQPLQPLSEEEMGNVTGQEGILISLEFYYNSEKTNDPATTGQRLSGFCSTPNGGTSLGNQNCRLGIQIANRLDNWLVIKNGYSSISVNRLSFDAAFLGDAASAANTGYFNLEKFRDASGNCLLETNSCTTTTIAESPALRTHYPETSGSYNPATQATSGFNDVRFGMYVEGMAVEFNSGPGLQDGWQQNNNGSFLGLNIADNNGNQAGIAFGGDFYLYGF